MPELYREATIKDGFTVLKNLRQEDIREVEGMGANLLHVPFSVLISEHPTFFYTPEGEAAGIAGVVRVDNNIGQVWMLCTPAITKVPITFFRQSKRWIEEVEKDYSLLWNYADSRNHLHHRLLKFLGFTALRTVEMGPNQIPYYEIVRTCVSHQQQYLSHR